MCDGIAADLQGVVASEDGAAFEVEDAGGACGGGSDDLVDAAVVEGCDRFVERVWKAVGQQPVPGESNARGERDGPQGGIVMQKYLSGVVVWLPALS